MADTILHKIWINCTTYCVHQVSWNWFESKSKKIVQRRNFKVNSDSMANTIFSRMLIYEFWDNLIFLWNYVSAHLYIARKVLFQVTLNGAKSNQEQKTTLNTRCVMADTMFLFLKDCLYITQNLKHGWPLHKDKNTYF